MSINEYFIIYYVYIFLIDATHLNGANSCLCVGCDHAIKKRSSTKNRGKRACIIMGCEQIACHIFNSKLIDVLKSSLLIKKDSKVCKILFVGNLNFSIYKLK